MAKKNTKKKSAKKKVVKNRKVLTEDQREELKAEGELPKKSVVKRENKQLIWFLVVVIIVFGAFLIPYFWVESNKVFEYVGAEWVIEEYAEPLGDVYHGRFPSFTNPDLFFNVYLRNDPRNNDVDTVGVFNQFKYGGIIAATPEANLCRGELPRVMFDVASFTKTAIGAGPIETGFTDEKLADDTGKRYATCESVNDRTLIIFDIGEPAVIQDEDNLNCYTIYVEDCDKSEPAEKFIIKTIEDFITAE